MSLKKLVIFFVIIGLSISITYQVTSFSAADVNSEAGIMVTSSENALIGVPRLINGGTIIQGSSKNINITIRNNMSNAIKLIGIENTDSGVNVMQDNTIIILPGDTEEVPLAVAADLNAEVGDRLINMVYRLEWGEGSAVIEGNLSVDIQKPIEIQSTVQNIVVNKGTLVEVEIVNKSGINHKILNIEFPEDKCITTDLAQAKIEDNKIILPITITSMEPNLYEIPAIFTIDTDGCVTTIETKLFLDIALNEEKAGVLPNDGKTNDFIRSEETYNADDINIDTKGADDNK